MEPKEFEAWGRAVADHAAALILAEIPAAQLPEPGKTVRAVLGRRGYISRYVHLSGHRWIAVSGCSGHRACWRRTTRQDESSRAGRRVTGTAWYSVSCSSSTSPMGGGSRRRDSLCCTLTVSPNCTLAHLHDELREFVFEEEAGVEDELDEPRSDALTAALAAGGVAADADGLQALPFVIEVDPEVAAALRP